MGQRFFTPFRPPRFSKPSQFFSKRKQHLLFEKNFFVPLSAA